MKDLRKVAMSNIPELSELQNFAEKIMDELDVKMKSLEKAYNNGDIEINDYDMQFENVLKAYQDAVYQISNAIEETQKFKKLLD